MARKFNLERDLKRKQKKGIYNPKVKIFSIIALVILTFGIGITYSIFSYESGDYSAFNSGINKKINVTVNVTNGILKKENGYILPGTLADKILSDNEVQTNPNFSSSHTDNGLFVQKDDATKSINGDPTYYYRGTVDNNYVSFAGLTWRIVRINEDGTIRLISANEYEGGVYSNNDATYDTSLVKSRIDTWYAGLSNNDKEYISLGKFCNDVTKTANSRLRDNPTFVCPDGANYLSLNAGLITADELIYSGSSLGNYSSTFINNGWNWTMTQASDSSMYIALVNGVWDYDSNFNTSSRSHRYVINLKAESLYASGDGTSSNPYTISGIASGSNSTSLTTTYSTSTEINLRPYSNYAVDTISCTNNQTANFDKDTNKLSISPTKDTTCTVSFRKLSKLKDTIIADNTLQTSTPNFAYGAPNTTLTSNASGLFRAADDLGTSYYFRGNITNNYVSFGGFIWRVVRINGDGTIRMVYDGTTAHTNGEDSSDRYVGTSAFNPSSNDPKYVGYTYDNTYDDNGFVTSGTASTMKTYLEKWYQTNIVDNNLDGYVAESIYCNDTTTSSTSGSTIYYGVYGRIYKTSGNAPILTCPTTDKDYGGKYKLKVGLLSADEMAMAGLGYPSTNYYATTDNYIYSNIYWYSMSPRTFNTSNGYMINGYQGRIFNFYTTAARDVRPVINLRTDTLITQGDGTQSSPYEVAY